MEEGPTEAAHGQAWREPPDVAAGSGWVTTDVAARAVRVSPRTIRRLIQRGELVAKAEGVGVERRWLVSVDSLRAYRAARTERGVVPRHVREEEEEVADNIADVLRDLAAQVEERTAEAVELRTRLDITERAQSTVAEEGKRLREENERLRTVLEAERSKGFLRRLFGGR
jgi:hypothetical protein